MPSSTEKERKVIDVSIELNEQKSEIDSCGNDEAAKKIQDDSFDEDEEEYETHVKLWTVPFRIVFALAFLYFFICSLDLVGSAFKLLGGKAAGEVFSNNHILDNPIGGVMIGILGTVLLQSSSTSTSLVVAMVAAEIIPVDKAVFIIMGANIGTSVTNTIVSLGQIQNDRMYERAFAAATVHDMFNIMATTIFLPLEWVTQFLTRLTHEMVKNLDFETNEDAEVELLSRITDPLTDKVVMINKTIIKELSKGHEVGKEEQILQLYCDGYKWSADNPPPENRERCESLFSQWDLSDKAAGAILLAISLIIMFICLFFLVKILQSIFKGHIAKVVKKYVNTEFPGIFSFLTGYLAMAIGAGMTILVQSSSVFTSTLTPLVGLNIITLQRAYPTTLGSNIGTTVTGLLAALASDSNFEEALQIALCHLFFNIFAIMIFYPIPKMRIPIALAIKLGKVTRKYKWFGLVYIIVLFLLFPAAAFGLSQAGDAYIIALFCAIILFIVVLTAVKLVQKYKPQWLPEKLRDFKFLPKWMRSLEPYHNFGVSLIMTIKNCICKRVAGLKNHESNSEELPKAIYRKKTDDEYSGAHFAVETKLNPAYDESTDNQ